MSLLPNRGDVITMRERGLLNLRVQPEQQEELLEFLEKLDQPNHAIRTQLFVLRATEALSDEALSDEALSDEALSDEALSDEALNGFSGTLDSVSAHVSSLMEDGKVTLSNQTEITTLDQPKAKIQVGLKSRRSPGKPLRATDLFEATKQFR